MGTPLAFAAWNEGEPNNRGEVNIPAWAGGPWNDLACDAPRAGHLPDAVRAGTLAAGASGDDDSATVGDTVAGGAGSSLTPVATCGVPKRAGPRDPGELLRAG